MHDEAMHGLFGFQGLSEEIESSVKKKYLLAAFLMASALFLKEKKERASMLLDKRSEFLLGWRLMIEREKD
jgi:hypothetical protein